jgi:hypothetical protein
MNIFGRTVEAKYPDEYSSNFINKGTIATDKLKEYYPEFYNDFKDKIDSGRIIFIDETGAMESGVIIDTKTHETLFVDYRC